jgi:enterochelin esterase-like enzyme
VTATVIANIAKRSRLTAWIAALALLAMMAWATPAAAGDGTGPVHVSSGRIIDLGIVKSRYADPRRVVVWLPDGYRPHGPKHAVLYMHDGQNLFDKATAGYGMEWGIDETLGRLIRERKVRPTIVVGMWNTPKRLQEYVPCKAFNSLPADYRGKVKALYGGQPLSDGYL